MHLCIRGEKPGSQDFLWLSPRRRRDHGLGSKHRSALLEARNCAPQPQQLGYGSQVGHGLPSNSPRLFTFATSRLGFLITSSNLSSLCYRLGRSTLTPRCSPSRDFRSLFSSPPSSLRPLPFRSSLLKRNCVCSLQMTLTLP